MNTHERSTLRDTIFHTMEQWTTALAREHILDFEKLDPSGQSRLLKELNSRFPPHVFDDHRAKRRTALGNEERIARLLSESTPSFPVVIDASEATPQADFSGVGVVLTAGGEGERLRLSLQKRGIPETSLQDFTKATFPLPELTFPAGTLQVNLSLLGRISQSYGIQIPVVVTTGPEGSTTDRVIGTMARDKDLFGLNHIRVLAQNERLHLTNEEKIVYSLPDGYPVPVTNPDETGGPLMRLREVDPETGSSALEWMMELGCTTLLVLQGTAVYDPAMLSALACAANLHDGVGVGIRRTSFPESDPYGTFVNLRHGTTDRLQIVEQQSMTNRIRSLKDSKGFHLPYNTGFYALSPELLLKSELPDYATSPKEIRPDLPRAPKIGYAATDLLPLARSSAVLAIDPSRFAVLKNADDLPRLSEMVRAFGLEPAGK